MKRNTRFKGRQPIFPSRFPTPPIVEEGWTPLQLSSLDGWLKSNGPFWQDSGRTTPATVDTNLVGAWDDSSGLGHHAIQTTSDERMVLKLAIINGYSVLRGGTLLPGSGNSKESLVMPMTAGATKSVFVSAIKRNDPAGASLCLFCLDDDAGANNNFYTVFETTEEYIWKYWNGSGKTPLPGNDCRTWNVIGANYTAVTNVDLYVNSSTKIDSANPADDYSTSTSLTIGAYADGTLHQNGDYDILEVVVCNDQLSAEDIVLLLTYMTAKIA